MYLHGRPGFIRGVADVFQRALGALWPPGDAQSAPVMDNLVRVFDPLRLWDYLHQILLDVFRVVGFCQLQASRNAVHVSIHHYAYSFSKP
jgi:hypothetical protein